MATGWSCGGEKMRKCRFRVGGWGGGQGKKMLRVIFLGGKVRKC